MGGWNVYRKQTKRGGKGKHEGMHLSGRRPYLSKLEQSRAKLRAVIAVFVAKRTKAIYRYLDYWYHVNVDSLARSPYSTFTQHTQRQSVELRMHIPPPAWNPEAARLSSDRRAPTKAAAPAATALAAAETSGRQTAEKRLLKPEWAPSFARHSPLT